MMPSNLAGPEPGSLHVHLSPDWGNSISGGQMLEPRTRHLERQCYSGGIMSLHVEDGSVHLA